MKRRHEFHGFRQNLEVAKEQRLSLAGEATHDLDLIERVMGVPERQRQRLKDLKVDPGLFMRSKGKANSYTMYRCLPTQVSDGPV